MTDENESNESNESNENNLSSFESSIQELESLVRKLEQERCPWRNPSRPLSAACN